MFLPQIRCKIPRSARMKESLNHRDLHGIGTLPYSRFLLALLGMLATPLSGREVGLLLHHRVLASVQTLLRLIGPEVVHLNRNLVRANHSKFVRVQLLHQQRMSNITSKLNDIFNNLKTIHQIRKGRCSTLMFNLHVRN